MNDDQQAAEDNLIANAIDSAEDIRDPLDGLVEKTSVDPGSPFEPDVLERLAALKKDGGFHGALSSMQNRKELYELLAYTPGERWDFPTNGR